MADQRAAGADARGIPGVDVTRRIKRPPMEVFKAWTDPERIAIWISPGTPNVKASIEPRAGGHFRIDLIHEGKPSRLDGEVLEIVPGKRLRFTWVTPDVPKEIGSVVTVTFSDVGGQTDLRVVHEGFPNEKQRADHDGGWAQILELFMKAENMSAASLRAIIG